jgi:hypothetical protein
MIVLLAILGTYALAYLATTWAVTRKIDKGIQGW